MITYIYHGPKLYETDFLLAGISDFIKNEELSVFSDELSWLLFPPNYFSAYLFPSGTSGKVTAFYFFDEIISISSGRPVSY